MHKKKLIEAALPLPELNDASAFDKRPGIGAHPKGIHHWWARLPLPTARAILFASVVDDPEAHPEKWPTEEEQSAERERLFDILRRMMAKKLHEAPEVYAEARAEMLKHCDGTLPSVLDPFAGGGSIPLEANRLGFDAHAGDLNPVAVLLNKCNLEIAPRWIDHAPINPTDRIQFGGRESWQGTDGLACDIRYYGNLVKERCLEKVRHLYPTIQLPQEFGGGETNVIAWLWVRTVASPNPAAQGKQVPLASTFMLCSKKGGEAWVEPLVNAQEGTYSFQVRYGPPQNPAKVKAGTKLGRRARFRCLLTKEPLDERHIKAEGKAGKLAFRLLAIVAQGQRGRVYLSPTREHERAAVIEAPKDFLDEPLADDPRNIWCIGYGLQKFSELFTPRQLTSLKLLSDLIVGVKEDVVNDAKSAALKDDDAQDYAASIITFLALALGRSADSNNALCRWDQSAAGQRVKNLFGRQAIPMLWDFAEANILGDTSVCWANAVEITATSASAIIVEREHIGSARQMDAAAGTDGIDNLMISTDPPYYDNISYAGLSDFFYVWLRKTLSSTYPSLFGTMVVPKVSELTASPERFDGDKGRAKSHFEQGFRSAFTSLRNNMDKRFPLTVYYAFKQDDERGNFEPNDVEQIVDLTTGWETLLEALVSSGFQITGTWPVRASQKWRMISMGTNSLASYIVLACRPRPKDAAQVASSQFRNELKRTLPIALRHLQQGNIAPVDFAQAAIGPGMAVYSKYGRILDSAGKAMTVRTALGIINQTLTEVLSELEDEFDNDTRWAISWFEQNGFSEGDYGDAELLSKAKVTTVEGLHQAGIVKRGGGKVRLLASPELPADWDPASDRRLSVWEMTHHLLRLYHFEKVGDEATGAVLRRLGSAGEVARELAYRLHNISERRKWSQEAQGYNALVLGWPEIARLASEMPAVPEPPAQGTLI